MLACSPQTSPISWTTQLPLSYRQVTLSSSSWGNRSSSSSTGTITSPCCSTPGTPTKTWWPAAGGSWPWTTWSTPSCTLTTPCGRPASSYRASSPCSSHWPRSPRCWWDVWSTTWCTRGCSRARSVHPTCRTLCGPPSCTSATLCSLSSSSLRPTSASPNHRPPLSPRRASKQMP